MLLLLLAAGVHGEEYTERFDDYLAVSYVSIYGDAYFTYVDTNGDGVADAVAVLDSVTGNVRVVKFGTASVYTTFRVEIGDSYAITSLTRDETPEILVAGKALWAYSPEGEKLWEAPLPAQARAIAVADLNGDGKPEVGVAAGSTVSAYSRGTKLWSIDLPSTVFWLMGFDRDGDGAADSLVAVERQAVTFLSGDGSVVKRYGVSYFPKPVVSAGVADVDDDGAFGEVVVVDNRGSVRVYTPSSELWEGRVFYEEGWKVRVLDSEDTKGVVVLSTFLYRFLKDGTREKLFGVPVKDAVMVDFNGDGTAEGIVGVTKSKIYAILNGKQVGYYEKDGTKKAPYNRTGAAAVFPFDYDGDLRIDDLIAIQPEERSLIVIPHSTAGAKVRMVVVANLIDYPLADDLFEYLRNAGYEPVHVLPDRFSEYRTARKIVILGGHLAPGTGEIVSELLSDEQKAELEKKGAVKRFVFRDVWAPGQVVTVLAGNTRKETRQAHLRYRGKL